MQLFGQRIRLQSILHLLLALALQAPRRGAAHLQMRGVGWIRRKLFYCGFGLLCAPGDREVQQVFEKEEEQQQIHT